MSGQQPPLTCKEVKTALSFLGFAERDGSGSHVHYVGTYRGRFRKVTVDCPKAPFSPILIKSMADQAGLTKKELYAAVNKVKPVNWP